eukprot:snap_masked-scaffold_3-processed-gene-16.34-mRNA-1 protein AED:1.00 eAED:1.00 QI:0/0/0/0/1/1/2/0/64
MLYCSSLNAIIFLSKLHKNFHFLDVVYMSAGEDNAASLARRLSYRARGDLYADSALNDRCQSVE